MTDKYAGTMPDNFFRKLSAREEEKFRKHARDTWSPTVPENFGLFHPVVRDEWRKLDLERLEKL